MADGRGGRSAATFGSMRWPLLGSCGLLLACSADPEEGGTSFGTTEPPPDPTTITAAGSTGPDTTSGDSVTSSSSDGDATTGADSTSTAGETTEGAGCETPTIFYADTDEDGFGDPGSPMEACEAPVGYVDDDSDCDDALPMVNPLADELCDGFDNDCDGILDEWSAASDFCETCELYQRQGSVYWFCPGPVNRFAARDFCLDHGADLTSIADLPEDSFVRSNVFGALDWFIGLEDLAVEGTYVWSDGSPANYFAWAPGEPNNIDNENCVELALEDSYNWNDTNCENQQSFVCEAVEPVPR